MFSKGDNSIAFFRLSVFIRIRAHAEGALAKSTIDEANGKK